MNVETSKTIEFDIRGQICPATLLVALKEINRYFPEINKGVTRLIFKTDNRDATNSIPATACNMGLHATVEKTDSGYDIIISN